MRLQQFPGHLAPGDFRVSHWAASNCFEPGLTGFKTILSGPVSVLR